jgi:hypothetical protein
MPNIQRISQAATRAAMGFSEVPARPAVGRKNRAAIADRAILIGD